MLLAQAGEMLKVRAVLQVYSFYWSRFSQALISRDENEGGQPLPVVVKLAELEQAAAAAPAFDELLVSIQSADSSDKGESIFWIYYTHLERLLNTLTLRCCGHDPKDRRGCCCPQTSRGSHRVGGEPAGDSHGRYADCWSSSGEGQVPPRRCQANFPGRSGGAESEDQAGVWHVRVDIHRLLNVILLLQEIDEAEKAEAVS